jgi:hypothetical protein
VRGIESVLDGAMPLGVTREPISVTTLASKAQRFFMIADGQVCPRFGDEMGNGSSVGWRQALNLKEDEGMERRFVEGITVFRWLPSPVSTISPPSACVKSKFSFSEANRGFEMRIRAHREGEWKGRGGGGGSLQGICHRSLESV